MRITAKDGHVFDAYVAGPEDAKCGLVIVQEIFGVNSHMRSVAERFAGEGYRVICPALFDRAEAGVELGYTADDVQKGLSLRAQIDEVNTLMDIDACAAAFLPESKVGIVGYCWGGTIAWLAVCRPGHRFSAASCWYGGGIAQAKGKEPTVPVQMHFGEKDDSIPMHDIDEIRIAQPEVEIYTYAHAGHGFGCDQRPSFQAEAARQAQERTVSFFDKFLKG